MTRILTTLLLLAGCGTSTSTSTPTPDHGHEHHDEASGHGHDASGGHHPASAATTTAPTAPAPVSLGSWTATLEPGAEKLRITARDDSGTAVSPSGEIRVVLTGTGEEEQRVVLTAAAGGWSGSARAVGAPGYVAVLSATVDGRTETARATWGQVPAAAPAHDEPHTHDDQGDHGHDHGHEH